MHSGTRLCNCGCSPVSHTRLWCTSCIVYDCLVYIFKLETLNRTWLSNGENLQSWPSFIENSCLSKRLVHNTCATSLQKKKMVVDLNFIFILTAVKSVWLESITSWKWCGKPDIINMLGWQCDWKCDKGGVKIILFIVKKCKYA